jgi:nucleoside-diphosphate-sugar epimerase
MRVLILGAGGYVGSRLVEALRNSDWAVPVAALRPQAKIRVSRSGVEARNYEATDPSSVRPALGNIDCVVNSVAGAPTAIAEGAKFLFDCAAETKIQRIVHMSSMAVYGDVAGTVDETSPLRSDGDGYARAKVAAERFAEEYRQRGGNVVILRPSCIYGPGSEQWTSRIGKLLRQGRLGDLGRNGDGYCNLIYIDDMIDAIVQAIRRPGIDGQAFNTSNAIVDTWNRYFIDFGRALGATPIRRISPRRLKLESTLGAVLLKGAAEASRRLGIGAAHLPPAVTPSLVRLWRQEIRLDHRKSRELLAFSLTPISDGIARSALWLKG